MVQTIHRPQSHLPERAACDGAIGEGASGSLRNLLRHNAALPEHHGALNLLQNLHPPKHLYPACTDHQRVLYALQLPYRKPGGDRKVSEEGGEAGLQADASRARGGGL